MMNGLSASAARTYHEKTKHSHQSIRSGSHSLDFSNQPMPFKVYPRIEPIGLTVDPPRAGSNVIQCITTGGERASGDQAIGLDVLSRIFFLTAGVTKEIKVGGKPHYFRAASCTGALYHIELYLICGDLPGSQGESLPAGVYHLAVHDYSARCLRSGDFRASVARAVGEDDASSATIVFTSTFWRNAWKYGPRAYRHSFWDSGTMLANFLAASGSFGLKARVHAGFDDEEINQLLGLNPREEAAVAMVSLGGRAEPPSRFKGMEPIRHETVPLSDSPIEYPEILNVHTATSLHGEADVRRWRARAANFFKEGESPSSFELEAGRAELRVFPLTGFKPSKDALDDVILRRGSARRFDRRPIGRFGDLSVVLQAATRNLPLDFLPVGRSHLNDLFLIVHAVEGLPSGAYKFDRRRNALVLLKAGDFRQEAGYLGLEQSLAADAAVNVYFLCDLESALDGIGERGYRAAQLEAAIMGGKIYLASYAQGLAATGLTFYDDDVISFFGPHAKGKEVMFLVLMGHRGKIPLINRVA